MSDEPRVGRSSEMSLEDPSVQDGVVQRRAPVQPLWKDLISTVLALVVSWGIARNSHYHGFWYVFAWVMTVLWLVVLVLRQLGVIRPNRRGR